MARKIWRHTMTTSEQKLWNADGMQGWREAFQACVEDDARQEGCAKYQIHDRTTAVVAKGDVRKLVLESTVN